MKNLLIALSIFGNIYCLSAQRAIYGTVTDSSTGEPLIGATVRLDSNQGTITDEYGRFSITASTNDTLKISYLGYEAEQVLVGAQQQLTINLTSNYQLESLVIRGVRALENDPVAKTTLSHQEIEREYVGQHPIFILDKKTPGIYSYSESGTSVGNYGNIRLRGISQERINFTLNGVPLNDMIDQGVFFSNFSDISNNFESIQVQRGVGTSSNGVSSYGGSINFESINLKRNPIGSSLELGAGSFNTFRANYNVNTGISDKGFGFYSSFGRLWSDGYKDFTESDAYSFFITGGYYGDRDMFRVTAFTSRSRNGLGYYVVDKTTLENDPTYNPLIDDDNDDFSQYLIQLQHTHKFNKQWNMSSSLYYGGAGGDFAEGTLDDDSIYVENYYGTYYTTFFQINYPLKNDHFGLISNVFFENEKLNFSMGVHAYTFQRQNRESILPHDSNPYYVENSSKNELSWFGKVDYRLGPLSLFGDLQIRTLQLNINPDYNFIGTNDQGIIQKSWTFINPKTGINYTLDQNQKLYLSYGYTGREPTKVDLFGGFQLNASNIDFVKSETGFKPEYVQDIEAGYKLSLQKLSIESNLYYMIFQNEIAPIGEVVAFGVQKRQNIPHSVRRGIELSWNWSPTKYFSIHGNSAFLNTSIQQFSIYGDTTYYDKQHILSPNWISNESITFTPGEDVSLTITHHFLTEQFMELTNDPDLVVPGWSTFDLNINWKLKPNINLSLMLNNLLDRQYYSYGAPDFNGNPAFLIQPPRNIYLTTKIRF
ncbi:MAG: TonB-dependent receptor [Bacteroidota bacterium]